MENEIEEKVLCQVALFGIFLATSAHIFFLALATLLISQFPRGHATKDPPSTGGPWIVRLLVLGKNRINQSAKYLANAFIWLMAYAMFWQNPVINATFGQN